jgi:hypothetical protein
VALLAGDFADGIAEAFIDEPDGLGIVSPVLHRNFLK